MFRDDWGSHVISPAPITGKPFKASYEEARADNSPGGLVIRRTLSGEIYRDSKGRIRQELHLEDETGENIRIVFITDPIQEAIYILNIDSQTYIIERIAAERVTSAGLSLIPPQASASSENEDLGRREIEGLVCRGYRSGSENVMMEVWYSDELRVALVEKRASPHGEDTLRLFDFHQTDSQSECFVVPADYVMTDEAHTGTAFLSPTGAEEVGANDTGLNLAAACGDMGAVQSLLKQGIDVNARSHHDETALMAAAECGHAALVTMLLNAGADVEARSKAGTTALMHAALNGHTEIVRALLAEDAKTDFEGDRQTPLMFAAFTGHVEIVELLLAVGTNVNAKESHNMTALMFAAGAGFLVVARALLAAGADVMVRNTDGYTALMIAGLAGQMDMVRLLEGAESLG